MSTDGIAPPNACACDCKKSASDFMKRQLELMQKVQKEAQSNPLQLIFANKDLDPAAPLGPPPVHEEYGQLPIRPRLNYVLVVMDEAPKEQVSPGGVVIPGKQGLEELGSVGEVILIGPGRTQNGKHVPVSGLQVGDRVRLGQYASTVYERKHAGRTFVLVPDDNIIGIEPPAAAEPSEYAEYAKALPAQGPDA